MKKSVERIIADTFFIDMSPPFTDFNPDADLQMHISCPGGKERSVSKNTPPRAAEIPCDTFAGFKFHGQLASVTRLPALLRFFHGLSSGVWLRYSVAITETPYAKRYIFL
jgi:hypothetical protein